MSRVHTDILISAALCIEMRYEEFICHALHFGLARCEEPDAEGAYEELLDAVEDRLAPHVSYGAWLDANHPEVAAGLTDEQRSVGERNARLAWIDSLIEEFEDKP